MKPYAETQEALGRLDRPRQLAFAARCAQALLPVIERLGAPETVDATRRACAFVWDAARGAGGDVAPIADALFELPEADVDDSNTPAYLCMCAIGVVSDAIEAVRADSPRESSAFAAEGAQSFLAGVDLVGEYGMDAVRIEDPSKPVEPGPCEVAEHEDQLRSLEILAGATPSDLGAAIDAVEQLAHQRARAIRELLPQYLARQFGVGGIDRSP